MEVPLTDPWFEAEFLTASTAAGWRRQDSLQGADGLILWCPCGYGKPEFPIDGGRPHAIVVSFANPVGCAPAPADAGSHGRDGAPTRWTLTGSSLADLTLTPSIDVGTPSCWHGYITGGKVVIP